MTSRKPKKSNTFISRKIFRDPIFMKLSPNFPTCSFLLRLLDMWLKRYTYFPVGWAGRCLICGWVSSHPFLANLSASSFLSVPTRLGIHCIAILKPLGRQVCNILRHAIVRLQSVGVLEKSKNGCSGVPLENGLSRGQFQYTWCSFVDGLNCTVINTGVETYSSRPFFFFRCHLL